MVAMRMGRALWDTDLRRYFIWINHMIIISNNKYLNKLIK